MHAGNANQRFPFQVGAAENVPGIPGACATRTFAYLIRGPWSSSCGVTASAGIWWPRCYTCTGQDVFRKIGPAVVELVTTSARMCVPNGNSRTDPKGQWHGLRQFHRTWEGANQPSGCRITESAELGWPTGIPEYAGRANGNAVVHLRT